MTELARALAEDARMWLLDLARLAIAHVVGVSDAMPQPGAVPLGAADPRGCFVSLHRISGELRGCIGTFELRPLWEAVREMAVAAAIRDPRFTALTAAELAACVIEISALTRPSAARAEEVRPGMHGLMVQRGLYRGVLLPQVAVEYGWDRETFLDHTCIKAGLPAAAWRDGSVTIEVFTAEVFSESAPG
ncbi:MAG: AmmeMemoRadiSam system protein A [Deltaproteobacteria bacterium]|nr:AmmeMemoRadiSam system protein A [Deltaproteobacteria bacterium]